MSTLQRNKATIGIVNYKTLDFTRLCLRTIRKFTHYPYEVIVIDNDSRDSSLEYLQSLPWIRLIQRPGQAGESGARAHAVALDLALENCHTEFFISLHSDTFIRQANWLDELIGYFRADPRIACVGSGKLENTALWRQWLKKATDVRTFRRRLRRAPDPLGLYRYYNRTICSLYRTDVLKQEQLSFTMDQALGLTAGQRLYFELVDRGYGTVELPSAVMRRYVIHLAHATQVLNDDEFHLRRSTVRKCRRLIGGVMDDPLFREVRSDASLDR